MQHGIRQPPQHWQKPKPKFNKLLLVVPLLAGVIAGKSTHDDTTKLIAGLEQKADEYDAQGWKAMPSLATAIRKNHQVSKTALIRMHNPIGRIVIIEPGISEREIAMGELSNHERELFGDMTRKLTIAEKIHQEADKHKHQLLRTIIDNTTANAMLVAIITFIGVYLKRNLGGLGKKREEPVADGMEPSQKEVVPPPQPRERTQQERIDKRVINRLVRRLRKIMRMQEQKATTGEEPKPVLQDTPVQSTAVGVCSRTEVEHELGQDEMPEEHAETEPVAKPPGEVIYPEFGRPQPHTSIANETNRTITMMRAIFGRFNAQQQSMLDDAADDLKIFVEEYLRYLAKPTGHRGVFAVNRAPGGFKEKWKANGTEGFGEWRAFSKDTSRSSRVVVAINITDRKIALYSVETDHRKYASNLARFNPDRLNAVVIGE